MESIKTALKNNIVLFAVIIGLAGIISSFILAGGIEGIRGGSDISVTGTAEKIVESDEAKWNVSVVTTANQANYGIVTRQVTTASRNVVKYLVGKGLKEERITIQPITSAIVCETQNQTTYDSTGRQQCSGFYTYSIGQVIIIESDDVKKVKDLALNAPNDLTNLGVQVQTNSVDFFYTDIASLRVELLKEAGKNAKERAYAIAESTGGRIGRVTDASQGVFQVTQKNSTDVSDYGSYDTSTIEKKVTAIVRVSFQVK